MLPLLVMAALLGVSSFGCGMLPLSFVFSKTYLTRLTTIGTGLLLGTALGVIIPEGIEALADAHPSSEIPISRVALSLLCGFTFMLIIEQVFSPHSHSPGGYDTHLPMSNVKPSQLPGVEFDAELGELEQEQGLPGSSSTQATPSISTGVQDEPLAARKQAIPLTLGLVIHSLADGLALGVSFFPVSGNSASSSLSVIVFLAIIIHKLPTSLALTTSLLATSLPRQECKKHLAAFSASTPISAVLTYAFLEFFGASNNADWIGVSLLLSGGTFLNVATMVSHNSTSQSSGELSKRSQLVLTILGIFTPFALSSLLGHGH